MQVALVKKALADAVRAAGIPHLECYGFSPSAPAVPAFTVGAVVLDPNVTFGGADTAEITCTVLASMADDHDGQELLDTYLSRDGAKSIRAALLAARGAPGELALGGAADDMNILRIDAYRMVAYSGDDSTYYGADITVRVVGS